jgi:TPR repeat protein
VIVRICFFLLLFISNSAFAQIGFDNAMKLYQRGKFAEARQSFEALAAIGDQSALFNLGVMHYRGESFQQNSERAVALMRLANEGLDDPMFTDVIQRISKRFTPEQQKTADHLVTELRPEFGIDSVLSKVLPVPLDDEDCATPPKAMIKKIPIYPTAHAREGLMGVVFTSYTISPEGYARDVVIRTTSSNAFSKESALALNEFRYEKPVDGKPIYGHRQRFIFKLDNKEKVKTIRLRRELEKLKNSAEDGDLAAQFVYARRLNVFRYFDEFLQKIDLQYRTANEWYQKSARSGLADAQYEIGLNMLIGRGCEVDSENGMKWITAAALGGHSPAQRTLAQAAMEIDNQKTGSVISWLRNAAINDDYAAKVLLAWELATTSNSNFRNAEEALELLDGKSKIYYDPVRVQETTAAAYAVLGDFKKAVKHQKKAKKLADKNEWEIPLLNERLAMYEHGQPYYGSYY